MMIEAQPGVESQPAGQALAKIDIPRRFMLYLVRLHLAVAASDRLIPRLAAETELLLAEGFIEPHFFAGFSGGRKSVLPGIAARRTVLANHCSEFIQSPYARTGNLENNPIHRDMLFAAETAKLAFIANVIIGRDRKIVRAFAGDPVAAHAEGCGCLRRFAGVAVPQADIVLTGNGGYPLDQNVYQAVKGMTAAEAGIGVRIRHLLLPALTLGLTGVANITLHKMIAIMESDYVLFARARGESSGYIVKRHALRNLVLPAITLQFSSISEIFGGSVLVEQVFSYPGLGQAAVAAGTGSDVPLLMGITLITAAIVFLGNFLANVLYGVVDPRIRKGGLGL